jgi:NAD(P)-dependent dehydrogenase (short-subunit alcohol dehydrogenase family)
MNEPDRARFAGQAALITGAASGIGRAIASRLARERAHVVAVDRDAAGLEVMASALRDEGALVTPIAADLDTRAACIDVVAAAVATCGHLDVLGNVAGFARCERFTDITEEQYRSMMAVNTDAYFFLAQAAIPHLLERDGNIVNIASNAGSMGQAYAVVYCMTKGAIVQMTKALAMEYIRTGLRVNAIAPAGVMTNLVTTFQMPADIDADLALRASGLRGLAEPSEIADLFAYVASTDGRGFHGAVLAYDRGVTAG